MANILSLVWYKVLPAQFGGQKGIALFNHHVGKHHHIICLCSSNNEPTGNEGYVVINELPASKWQFADPFMVKKISSIISEHKITHIVLEHCYHGINGIRLAQQHGLKLIVHSHNIEYDRFRKMHTWWWRGLYLLEKKTHRAADLSMFQTEKDMHQAIQDFQLDPKRCMVVPHGLERDHIVDMDEKLKCRRILERRYGISFNTKIIYFNGTLDYEPNALALKEILERIIPAIASITSQSFLVLVTGRLIFSKYQYLKKLSHPSFLNAGLVEDVTTYFSGADIFINPVSTGGGIKVKLMEALAHGLSVISYASGAAGVDRSLTGTALNIVPDGDADQFAAELIRHWNDRPLPAEGFFRKYHWQTVSKQTAERIELL
jgi:glycosyltransferase involved in cell wall biosynthesis